jgi:ATP-dependent RNA helicase HrpB
MSELPIAETLPELQARLAGHAVVVLQAPPGAGKTTAVPPALLDAPWLAGRRIVLLEPRRLAARAAAARMAEVFGEPLGATVGYRIRFESKVSAGTRIEVVTEGILTRRLQTDPALEQVGLVIFDEFHERHLQTDLGLALTLDSQRVLRADLKILIMSATLDGTAVAKLLDAPLVVGSGRAFPVAVRYVTPPPDASIADRVVPQVRQALAADAGDILVFLPGAGEIRRAEALLRDLGGTVDVYPLYGDLSWEQQDRALRPGTRRKVILATPIAETSLTIDGVRVVVDAGYTRAPQFDPTTGLTRLTTTRASRAAADQRTGRAGRLGPGTCYRLWSESTQRGLLAQALPEIKTADLSGLALELALWGAKDAGELTWVDPPPPANLAQARDLLRELGALDAEGNITPLGRAMARLPLHPRLAHLVVTAAERGAAELACDIAALLSERDLYSAATRATVDLAARLEALAAYRAHGRDGARRLGADPGQCARIDQASRQWRRLVSAADATPPPSIDAGELLALAYPDRIAAQRDANGTRYLMANGRGVKLPEYESQLRAPYLVAAHVDAGAGEGLIHLAATITLEAIRAAAGARIETRDVVRWDPASAAVIARREERLGKLLLGALMLEHAPREAIRVAMLEGIRAMGLGALPWTPEARTWQARVSSLRAWLPEEGWPDVSDARLTASLQTWLAPYLNDCSRRDHLARLDLMSILRAQLNAEQTRRLHEGAPTHITVPSGSRVPLAYRAGEAPVLAVKLQEMFGATDTPRVGFGRIPVMLHLLSPARRPVQVTQDLHGFWSRTYAEVRKELKGRYPKHPWPEDPMQARPSARTVRRERR